ncbi:carbon catabolite repressor protein 4 homolog 3-like isoform X3 [Humulus lupulus]|uniref:carbon catabolite repressor protein 4 homolog 3-like isoform X3 n=1 Tax=Humulus lupulus TaxID=3486 RepID=UPI002B416607|nr:carbon catabolite repressor protein 4 homolog 3-like isoform X3 [Humulus lupulus]
MKSWCTLFPSLLLQSQLFKDDPRLTIPPGAKRCKEFNVHRMPVDSVPQTKVSGDCGVYAIKYIEHLLGRLPLDTICDDSMELFRNKWTVDLWQMCKDASRRLLIGNIHVLYNPSPGDVKLGQIHFLSSRAHVLSEKWGNVPVLLTGDFNSTPQSAIYKFMSSSELNVKLYDRRELSGQRSCHPAQVLGVKQEISSPLSLIDGLLKTSWKDEEIKVATGNSEGHVVVHSLNLNSSYATVKSYTGTREPNGEPLATSYHSKFLGTVDYIWYSDDLLPTRVLDTVSVDILMTTGGLPCQVH